ncbi:hypothetical protein, partial [Sphaerochaeta sp.]|uniref:hypothetical protein n=1 Tax=Sphaerochaeta sp. TaxID=1972642 RepID=UPI002A365167
MKRKFLVTLLVVCVLLPAALSAAIVDLSLGATAQYKPTLGTIKASADADDFSGFSKFENYALGADVRLKLLIAEVDLVGMFSQTTDDYTKIELLTTAGISLDLLGFARLGFGLGPNWIIEMNNDTGDFIMREKETNKITTLDNFGDTFINSPVAYRATVDFNLGGLMLGLNYTLETQYTFKNAQEVNKLFEAMMDVGKFGVSLL